MTEISEVNVSFGAGNEDWQNDAAGSFFKPLEGREYMVSFNKAPEKENDPFRDGERWVLDLDVDGAPMRYSPGKRFLGALSSAYVKNGKKWPLLARVKKFGEGMKVVWSIVPVE